MEEPRDRSRRAAARAVQQRHAGEQLYRKSHAEPARSKRLRCLLRSSGLAVTMALLTPACKTPAPIPPGEIVNVTEEFDDAGTQIILDHCGERIDAQHAGTPPDQPCP